MESGQDVPAGAKFADFPLRGPRSRLGAPPLDRSLTTPAGRTGHRMRRLPCQGCRPGRRRAVHPRLPPHRGRASGPGRAARGPAYRHGRSVGAADHGNEVRLVLRVGHAAVGTHQAAHGDALGVQLGLTFAADRGPRQPGPAGAGRVVASATEVTSAVRRFCSASAVSYSVFWSASRADVTRLTTLSTGAAVLSPVTRRTTMTGFPRYRAAPPQCGPGSPWAQLDRAAAAPSARSSSVAGHRHHQRTRQLARDLGDAVALLHHQDSNLHRSEPGRTRSPKSSPCARRRRRRRVGS